MYISGSLSRRTWGRDTGPDPEIKTGQVVVFTYLWRDPIRYGSTIPPKESRTPYRTCRNRISFLSSRSKKSHSSPILRREFYAEYHRSPDSTSRDTNFSTSQVSDRPDLLCPKDLTFRSSKRFGLQRLISSVRLNRTSPQNKLGVLSLV